MIDMKNLSFAGSRVLAAFYDFALAHGIDACGGCVEKETGAQRFMDNLRDW